MLVLDVGDVIEDIECVEVITDYIDERHYRTKYRMRCQKCGREKIMLPSSIRNHLCTSHKACGKGIKTKYPIFYERWQAMRTRTKNTNYHAYHRYGERGINSDEFEYFIDFYDAMFDSYMELANKIGEHNTSLERIDFDKPYSKDNCCWVHKKSQPCNTCRIIMFKVIYPDGKEEIHNNLTGFAKQLCLNVSAVRQNLVDNDKRKENPRAYKGYTFIRITE